VNAFSLQYIQSDQHHCMHSTPESIHQSTVPQLKANLPAASLLYYTFTFILHTILPYLSLTLYNIIIYYLTTLPKIPVAFYFLPIHKPYYLYSFAKFPERERASHINYCSTGNPTRSRFFFIEHPRKRSKVRNEEQLNLTLSLQF
jgi:hypothetical protein